MPLLQQRNNGIKIEFAYAGHIITSRKHFNCVLYRIKKKLTNGTPSLQHAESLTEIAAKFFAGNAITGYGAIPMSYEAEAEQIKRPSYILRRSGN